MHRNMVCWPKVAVAGALAFSMVGCTAVMLSEPVRYAGPHEAKFVPPGYMPPPGQCRIWYPNQSASQQPPPGDCAELRQRTPPGATLVYGS